MQISRRGALASGLGLAGCSLLTAPVSGAQAATSEVPEGAVILVAELKAKAGEEDAVKKALKAMVAPTREEKGCLCYNLHQGTQDKSVFLFYEQWASQEAFDAHGKTPHMKAMQQALDGRLEKGGATFLDLVD